MLAAGVMLGVCAMATSALAAPPRGGLHGKVAAPGAGALAAEWRSIPAHGAVFWCGVGTETLQHARAGAGVWLPVGDEQELGLALRAGTERTAFLAFGWADQKWGGAEVDVPVIQPPARPLRTRWSVWHALSLGRGAFGRATAHWAPGSAPHIDLMVRAGRWRARAGSGGASVALQVSDRPIWVQVGIHRGDVPWCGLTLGRPLLNWRSGFSAASRSFHRTAW